MTQLAAISQDPWFSRVQHPEIRRLRSRSISIRRTVCRSRSVLDVARWIRDELDALGALGVPKTSGADGLHVYIPLPPGTPYEAGLLFCQIVATSWRRNTEGGDGRTRASGRAAQRVYVDYLQNILGKTLATALQRARQRVRRRLDAADMEGSGRRRPTARTSRSPRCPNV